MSIVDSWTIQPITPLGYFIIFIVDIRNIVVLALISMNDVKIIVNFISNNYRYGNGKVFTWSYDFVTRIRCQMNTIGYDCS